MPVEFVECLGLEYVRVRKTPDPDLSPNPSVSGRATFSFVLHWALRIAAPSPHGLSHLPHASPFALALTPTQASPGPSTHLSVAEVTDGQAHDTLDELEAHERAWVVGELGDRVARVTLHVALKKDDLRRLRRAPVLLVAYERKVVKHRL